MERYVRKFKETHFTIAKNGFVINNEDIRDVEQLFDEEGIKFKITPDIDKSKSKVYIKNKYFRDDAKFILKRFSIRYDNF